MIATFNKHNIVKWDMKEFMIKHDLQNIIT